MIENLDLSADDQSQDAWSGMQTGTVLAERYRIERPISRGGMGAVFEATQLGLDRRVAVKVLLPALSRDAKMQERFHREARSAAALHHPNIVQIHDYGISEHGPYIVMELVRGRSLREVLRGGPLAPARAVPITEQICLAVATAHEAGIIHRDLKPDNILIEEHTGGLSVVKVLDFGIAKLREAQAESKETTLTGASVLGSPSYMSPEQCLSLELDGRSDIYALGILLYEMLTGRVPFSGATAVAVMVQHVNAAPPSMRELRPEIPASIESVVMRSLAKERDRRHGDATELARELRLALAEPAAVEMEHTAAPTLALDDPFATNATPSLQAATPQPSSAKMRRRLAILPLRNLTGEAEIEFLGFALADSVIMQLACINSLIVRPSSAVESYRNLVVEPRTVGRELQVDTILSGSYLRAGDAFRVNVQLVDAERNEILWQERIDSKFDNVIALQDRICEELIRGLRLNLSTGEQEALKGGAAPNPMAYEFYLRGLAGGETFEGNQQAREMLECAVGLDPSYAPAWAALAGRYLKAHYYLNDDSMLQKGEAAIQKALAINPQLPAALFWGVCYYAECGDVKSAMVNCKRLLQVAPNSEFAYQAMGHAYEYAGLPDIALTLFRKANEVNPVGVPHMIGLIHYQKGEMAEARREFEAHQERCPEATYWLAVLDYLEGRPDEAVARLDGLLAHERPGHMSWISCALRCAIKGEKEESERMLRNFVDTGTQLAGHSHLVIAEVYAQLGDAPTCLAMLREAVKKGYCNYPFLMSDPLLAPVRTAEGFGEVAAEMQQRQAQMQLMMTAG